MQKNALINHLFIFLLGCFTQHALCSYNEVKFTMSRSYMIDTEGFAKLRAKADVYYKYSSTFFEIILRDPQYDTYLINQSRHNLILSNHSQNCSHDIQFRNYIVKFPLDFDEKVFNFSMSYDGKTYKRKTINSFFNQEGYSESYCFLNNKFTIISNNVNNFSKKLYRMKMITSVFNNTLIFNVSNMPVFFDFYTDNTGMNSTSNYNNMNSTLNEQQTNNSTKNKRKRRKRFVINQEKEDPIKRFFEVSIGFTIFKKLKIKNDKYGSKLAFYHFNYKTCDFCQSSKNLTRLHNFAFTFDLEGHQNDQLFKFGKPQRKCIIKELDLFGNPLKFNITENATNKNTFYGFLLKLRLVKFPAYSIIDDDTFSLPPVLEINSTNTSTNNITKINQEYFTSKNFSQFTKISIMPKSHRVLVLLDDDNQFWQTELENALTYYFPNSAHLIGHLHFKTNQDKTFSIPSENCTNKTHQNKFNTFDVDPEFNFDINVNLNKDNESDIENISNIIRMYKPEVIINFINETRNSTNELIFDKEKIYKKAFPENKSINFNDILYIESQGNLIFDPHIVDKIHQFEFLNKSVETNCGFQLIKEKEKVTNKRNRFSFLLANNCINCSFSFNNRSFYSWDMSIFPSKILFRTLIEHKIKKGILPKDFLKKINWISKDVNDIIEHKTVSNQIFEIVGPSFLSEADENGNINAEYEIDFINDCNKCTDFANICARQYEEEYLSNNTKLSP